MKLRMSYKEDLHKENSLSPISFINNDDTNTPTKYNIPSLMSRYDSDSEDDSNTDCTHWHNQSSHNQYITNHNSNIYSEATQTITTRIHDQHHPELLSTPAESALSQHVTTDDTSTTQPTIIPTQVMAHTPTLAYIPTEGTHCMHPCHPNLQDNSYIGDVLELPKSAHTARIYVGVNLTHLGTWQDTCEHLQDIEVNIALVGEHKLDTTQPWVMKKLNNQARAIFGLGSFSLNVVSTTIESPTMYKPGGILSLVQGGMKGRILKSSSDPLRRWAFTSFWQNMGPPLTVIVTYQVVDIDPKTAGPTTFATQLHSLYTRDEQANPENLQRNHVHNLVSFVKTCQETENGS